jgi:hypothetical protein
VVAVRWSSSGWSGPLAKLSALGDADSGNNPAYYTSLQAANVDGDRRQELIGRDTGGINVYQLRSGTWTLMNRFYSPFSDTTQQPDCPFANESDVCFGSGPAYYDTIQLADINGNGREELLGRASDGVRTLRYQGNAPDAWGRLATLSALSDAGGYTDQKYWETIQFADIDGDGRAEALARDQNGLNAWSYSRATNSWTPVPTKTPLQLADDPWGSDRSYYSTIETGDVDGDGRADVVARGPYGIRTWFYNRRGTGGWERYLAEGYPDFPTAGQRAAFAALNNQAGDSIPGGGSNVRDVWQGEDPPAQQDLTSLRTLVLNVGNCSNQQQGLPPQYASCTPPQSSSGFTAAEWTSMLNEVIAEIFWAQQVWSHFYDPATGSRRSGSCWSTLSSLSSRSSPTTCAWTGPKRRTPRSPPPSGSPTCSASREQWSPSTPSSSRSSRPCGWPAR